MLLLRLLLAVIFLAAVTAIYVGFGTALCRRRKWCPACGAKGLKQVNWLRCNPPPNHGFFACDDCGGEFVQVDRYDGVENPMIPRVQSTWEHSPAWDVSKRRRATPRG